MGVGGGGPQVAPTAPFRPMKTGGAEGCLLGPSSDARRLATGRTNATVCLVWGIAAVSVVDWGDTSLDSAPDVWWPMWDRMDISKKFVAL